MLKSGAKSRSREKAKKHNPQKKTITFAHHNILNVINQKMWSEDNCSSEQNDSIQQHHTAKPSNRQYICKLQNGRKLAHWQKSTSPTKTSQQHTKAQTELRRVIPCNNAHENIMTTLHSSQIHFWKLGHNKIESWFNDFNTTLPWRAQPTTQKKKQKRKTPDLIHPVDPPSFVDWYRPAPLPTPSLTHTHTHTHT